MRQQGTRPPLQPLTSSGLSTRGRNAKGSTPRILRTRKQWSRSPDQLRRAVDNYARSVAGTDRQWILLGSTFFGPNDRWADYLSEPAPTEMVYTSPEVPKWD